MDVYVVLERYEDEVSPIVFGSDGQAKLHIRERRNSYPTDIEEPVKLVTDDTSHVYDQYGSWEMWCEKLEMR